MSTPTYLAIAVSASATAAIVLDADLVELAWYGSPEFETQANIEATLRKIISRYPERPILCGASLPAVMRMLAVDLGIGPYEFAAAQLDADTVQLLQPRLGETAKPAEHTAIAQLRYSVNVLRTARQMLKYLPPPKAKTR